MDQCNFYSSFIQTFSALLTIVIGIISTVILTRQYYLQKMRWRLERYDKHYPVFEATMDYLSFIVQHRSLSNDEFFNFSSNSKDKSFLFGKDIQKHIELLYDKGTEFQEIESVLKTLPKCEKRTIAVKKQSELFDFFKKQRDKSIKLFGDYLRIDKK